jgi:ATP-binding cassette subfamily B multidrug efflux pump
MKFINKRVTLDGALGGKSAGTVWRRHLIKLKWIYVAGVGALLLTALAEVGIPLLVKRAIDTLSLSDASKHRGVYVEILWTLVGLLLLQYIGRIVWRVSLAQQAHHTGARMKSLLWDRARFLPSRRLERDLRPGDLMNMATGDVQTARMTFSFSLVGSIDMVCIFTLTLAAMLSLNIELTLWTLVVLPALPYFLNRLAKREGLQHHESQESLSKLTDLAAQSVATVRLQRLTQTAAFWERRLVKSANGYMDRRLAVIRTALQFIPVTGIAPLISYGVLLVVGIRAVMDGTMTVGTFVAMQSYIFIIQTPLIELGYMISEWQRGFVSLRRILGLYREPEATQLREGGHAVQTESSSGLQSKTPAFRVEQLEFSYDPQEPGLFRGLSLEIPEGGRVGILGPVGAGKSTLLQVLAGFERDFKGTVEIFGRDVRGYSHESLRKLIALVPQRPFLFADTVRANLRLDRDLSDSEIWHWLDAAGVREDIERLPRALDTRLGEWGVNLSGGQKQRLTLARGLAARPRVLLLDDCLSAVDTVTEERILAALDRELRGTTLVWVAHRRSTLKHCSQILELERQRDGLLSREAQS